MRGIYTLHLSDSINHSYNYRKIMCVTRFSLQIYYRNIPIFSFNMSVFFGMVLPLHEIGKDM